MLSFPIDGKDELPTGSPRQLGDVVLCPEVVGERRGSAPLVHGLLHLLGYDHGEEMVRREEICSHERDEATRGPTPSGRVERAGRVAGAPHPSRATGRASSTTRSRRDPSIIQSFNYAFEGVIWALRTPAQHAHPLRRRGDRARAGVRLRRLEARADRAPARDRIRPDRGDGQHRDRGCHGHRDDVLRPAREAREGHRRRRGPRSPP